jgi:DNA topoisomerase VI subunit B
MKGNGKKAKLISEKKDPKTGITTRKYDVGTNMPKIVKTKASPAKKASCGSPVKMDIEGRKPKTRRNKAQKGVNKMLGGLANANRGCKPHRKIKSR